MVALKGMAGATNNNQVIDNAIGSGGISETGMPGGGKRVLVVEDEVALREALRIKLEASGFEVMVAENGRMGAEIALEQRPDLILLDLVMPEVDGLEMLKRIRLDVWGEKAEVIILTNVSDSEKVGECLALNALNYFVKSDSSLDKLVDKVKDVLNGVG